MAGKLFYCAAMSAHSLKVTAALQSPQKTHDSAALAASSTRFPNDLLNLRKALMKIFRYRIFLPVLAIAVYLLLSTSALAGEVVRVGFFEFGDYMTRDRNGHYPGTVIRNSHDISTSTGSTLQDLVSRPLAAHRVIN